MAWLPQFQQHGEEKFQNIGCSHYFARSSNHPFHWAPGFTFNPNASGLWFQKVFLSFKVFTFFSTTRSISSVALIPKGSTSLISIWHKKLSLCTILLHQIKDVLFNVGKVLQTFRLYSSRISGGTTQWFVNWMSMVSPTAKYIFNSNREGL